MRVVRSRRGTALTTFLFIALFVASVWRWSPRTITLPCSFDNHESSAQPSESTPHPICRTLPGAEDVLIILKTGATEFIDKFPIHLRTTLTCYPHSLVVSDHHESFHGVEIRDALVTVSEDVREHHNHFDFYRRLRDNGRGVLKDSELSGPGGNDGSDQSEKAGWVLDKWKFLPMLNMTWHHAPEKRWYMFVETDTSLFWSTLLKYTQQLDHTKQYYMGSQVMIGDDEFAHGGSGYLVSNAALQAAVSNYTENQKYWEEVTDRESCGDLMAGKVLRGSGSNVTRTWPIIQGDHPGVLEWGANGNNDQPRWCYPLMTYHHLGVDVIEDLWTFEQFWLAGKGRDVGYVRFKDVFEEYIMPRMLSPQRHWDNKCKDLHEDVRNLKDCIETCEKEESCLQYRWLPDAKQCQTSREPKLGEYAPLTSFRSGWMYERIEKWRDQRPECAMELWITGNP